MTTTAHLLYILSRKPLTIWEICAHTDYSIREIVDALNQLHDEKKITTDGGKIHPTAAQKVAAEPDWKQIEAKLDAIKEKRPAYNDDFDQDDMNTQSTVERARFMYERGDLEGKRVLLIGDDDLMSIALCLTGLPQRVVALDIDRELIEFINQVAKEQGLAVEGREYTVENPLPEDLTGTFDTANSEPVETLAGFELFVSRQIAGLREGSTLYVGISHTMSSLPKWQKFQQTILDAGFGITDMVRNQALYDDKEGEGEHDRARIKLYKIAKFPITPPKKSKKGEGWFYTTMYRCRAPGTPKPKITGKKVVDEALFQDEEQIVNCANPRESSETK